MYTCKTCGQTYSDPVKFCGKCGGDQFEAQQQGGYQQPAYGASYSNPAPAPSYSYAAPAPATASKAPAIVGMIFGIITLILAFVCIGFASEYSELADRAYSYYYYYGPSKSAIREAGYGALGVLSIFTVPSLIVGLVMSFKQSGIKAMSIVGRITSFVGLGLYIISFIIIASI